MNNKVTKKGVLLLTTIVQIIFAIYSLCFPEIILEAQGNTAGNTEFLLEELTSRSGFCVYIGIFALATILWDDIKYTKAYLVGWNILEFLCAPGIFTRIINIINLLILSSVKKARKPKVKVKLSEIEKLLEIPQMKMTKKKWIIIAALLLIYFGQNFISAEWLESKSHQFIIILTLLLHIIPFGLAITAFYEEIKEGMKKIYSNFKPFVRYIVKVGIDMIALIWLVSIVSVFITNKIHSVNQETIEMLPIYIIFPLAVIWAPFVEEAVFRGSIRKIIKNKTLYIIVSGLFFGIMHALSEETFVIALATSLPYAVIGGTFAYCYAKTNNIAVNILFHLAYNSLAVLASLSR